MTTTYELTTTELSSLVQQLPPGTLGEGSGATYESGVLSVPDALKPMIDAVDVSVPPRSELDAIKDDAKRRVAQRADQFEDQITGIVPRSERLSWSAKEAAARAHLAGTASAEQTAALQAEIAETGETLDDLANTVIAKAATYFKAAGAIAGHRRATMAQIDALDDLATVQADLAQIFADAEAKAQELLAGL